MSAYAALKETAWRCNMDLHAFALAVRTFGNASAVDRARGVIAIKPSGVPYAELRPEMMVVVGLDNTVVEGSLRPSSDTRTHTLLYRQFGTIGGVVHTHSPYATAWAQARRSIPVFGTTHADHLPEPIPCTAPLADSAIRGDYEEETGNIIVKTFARRSYVDVPMVLVAGHGPFAWGSTPEAAVENSVMLEELAKMAYFTLTINPSARPLKRSLIDKHFRRKHGPGSYYGQPREGRGKGEQR
ncbi:MAG TPA: L-ribulose-5-phosphate 4-epimerase AraD [Bacteroidota bacterium]|nr:L-ribulose-5-phosphate 4-epimerase AraD [Bacteroidota bacterium]